MAQIKLVCQNCNTPGTFEVGAITDGTAWGRCKRCHKSFPIIFKGGQMMEIKKVEKPVEVKEEKVKEPKKPKEEKPKEEKKPKEDRRPKEGKPAGEKK